MENELKKIAIRKLKTATLAETLAEMEVGEICDMPDGYGQKTVKVVCSNMKHQGYLFTTRTLPELGRQIIIRLR